MVILILLFLVLFIGCPYVIWRTARKAFKLRNLQIADLEARKNQANMPQPVAMAPGWYSDGNGGQRYWDGQTWIASAPPQGQAS